MIKTSKAVDYRPYKPYSQNEAEPCARCRDVLRSGMIHQPTAVEVLPRGEMATQSGSKGSVFEAASTMSYANISRAELLTTSVIYQIQSLSMNEALGLDV